MICQLPHQFRGQRVYFEQIAPQKMTRASAASALACGSAPGSKHKANQNALQHTTRASAQGDRITITRGCLTFHQSLSQQYQEANLLDINYVLA